MRKIFHFEAILTGGGWAVLFRFVRQTRPARSGKPPPSWGVQARGHLSRQRQVGGRVSLRPRQPRPPAPPRPGQGPRRAPGPILNQRLIDSFNQIKTSCFVLKRASQRLSRRSCLWNVLLPPGSPIPRPQDRCLRGKDGVSCRLQQRGVGGDRGDRCALPRPQTVRPDPKSSREVESAGFPTSQTCEIRESRKRFLLSTPNRVSGKGGVAVTAPVQCCVSSSPGVSCAPSPATRPVTAPGPPRRTGSDSILTLGSSGAAVHTCRRLRGRARVAWPRRGLLVLREPPPVPRTRPRRVQGGLWSVPRASP